MPRFPHKSKNRINASLRGVRFTRKILADMASSFHVRIVILSREVGYRF